MENEEEAQEVMKFPQRYQYPNYHQYALARQRWRVENKQRLKEA